MTHQKELFKRYMEFRKTEKVRLDDVTGIYVVGISHTRFISKSFSPTQAVKKGYDI